MLGAMKVLRRVLVFRRIATSYVTADETKPQVHPGVTGEHAVFANSLLRVLYFDLIEVAAVRGH